MAKEIQTPDWYEGEIPATSYRSLFKWGAPDEYKHPKDSLVKLMKSTLNLTEDDLAAPKNLGLETITIDQPVGLDTTHIQSLVAMVGEENVTSDTYTRIKAAYGQGMIDILRLREKQIEHLPDVVVHPRNKEDVMAIVAYCHQHRIPLYVVGGRSSVTRGYEAVKGGVSLDMTTHMNKVISLNETNQTVTVQPGIFGPAFESQLNNAVQTLGAKRAYTCGHFPQSFEYSTVGGWVAAKGAGQNSTYYGKIEDLVFSQEYVTPAGTLTTPAYPRCATGPDMDQIMIGSEAAFGVLVEVTLKIFRYRPENRKYFSYMFKNWQDAQAAARQIMQAESGFPSVFRISDPEETDIAMHLYHVAGTAADTALNLLGYQPGERCLMLGYTDGDKAFSKTLNRKIRQICRSYGTFNLSPFGVTKMWEHSRFKDPYMRDDLGDFGVITDTLECAVTWESMPKVHAQVREVIKARPNTICMTHISHAYPQGANLYFIYITPNKGLQDYLELEYSILTAIQQSGAAVSHHHGVGKFLAPWLPGMVGETHMNVLKSLKTHFDPHNIMNPGGTLALDMSPQQAAMRWGLEEKE